MYPSAFTSSMPVILLHAFPLHPALVLFLLSLSLFFSLLLDEANPLVKVYDLRFPSPTALPLSMQTSSLVVTSVSPTCFPLVGRA